MSQGSRPPGQILSPAQGAARQEPLRTAGFWPRWLWIFPPLTFTWRFFRSLLILMLFIDRILCYDFCFTAAGLNDREHLYWWLEVPWIKCPDFDSSYSCRSSELLARSTPWCNERLSSIRMFVIERLLHTSAEKRSSVWKLWLYYQTLLQSVLMANPYKWLCQNYRYTLFRTIRNFSPVSVERNQQIHENATIEKS